MVAICFPLASQALHQVVAGSCYALLELRGHALHQPRACGGGWKLRPRLTVAASAPKQMDTCSASWSAGAAAAVAAGALQPSANRSPMLRMLDTRILNGDKIVLGCTLCGCKSSLCTAVQWPRATCAACAAAGIGPGKMCPGPSWDRLTAVQRPLLTLSSAEAHANLRSG